MYSALSAKQQGFNETWKRDEPGNLPGQDNMVTAFWCIQAAFVMRIPVQIWLLCKAKYRDCCVFWSCITTSEQSHQS